MCQLLNASASQELRPRLYFFLFFRASARKVNKVSPEALVITRSKSSLLSAVEIRLGTVTMSLYTRSTLVETRLGYVPSDVSVAG